MEEWLATYQLLIVVVALFLSSVICKRLFIPTLAGFMVAGMITRAVSANLATPPEWLGVFALFGGLITMFLFGLQTSFSEMFRVSKRAVSVAVFGIAVPFASVFLLAESWRYGFAASVFLASVSSITFVVTSLAVLAEIKKLGGGTSMLLHAAAIIDEIFGLLLAFFVITAASTLTAQTALSAATLIDFAKFAGALLGFFALSYFAVPRIGRWIYERYSHVSVNTLTSVTLVFMVLFAYLSSKYAFESFLGAFLAGIALGDLHTVYKKEITHVFMLFGESLFFPIFFFWIGYSVDVQELEIGRAMLGFMAAFTLVALAAKFVGTYVGARLARINSAQSLALGAGMMPRGGIAIVAAFIGKEAGLLDQTLFASVIVMVLVSVIVSPFLVRKTFERVD
jgi:Kef-type K+ transport system membrane component KefB